MGEPIRDRKAMENAGTGRDAKTTRTKQVERRVAVALDLGDGPGGCLVRAHRVCSPEDAGGVGRAERRPKELWRKFARLAERNKWRGGETKSVGTEGLGGERMGRKGTERIGGEQDADGRSQAKNGRDRATKAESEGNARMMALKQERNGGSARKKTIERRSTKKVVRFGRGVAAERRATALGALEGSRCGRFERDRAHALSWQRRTAKASRRGGLPRRKAVAKGCK